MRKKRVRVQVWERERGAILWYKSRLKKKIYRNTKKKDAQREKTKKGRYIDREKI